MKDNKLCTLYLGVHIAESVLSKVFKSVERMPHGNIGYDFICPKGKKIDVKSACIRTQKGMEFWSFNIKRNIIADYFLCLAFNNREDLEPQHIWLIPGSIVNHVRAITIYKTPTNLFTWGEYELIGKLSDVVSCCEALKKVPIATVFL